MYECLLNHAYRNSIDVYETQMKGRIKGLYGNNIIWLNKSLLNSSAKKASVLSEELGHYHTSVGNITDQTNLSNRKQELRARIWAYEKVVPLYKIVQAHQQNIKNGFEFAEYLGITEDFLSAALMRYQNKYGLSVDYDKFTIYFDPLKVVESVSHKNFYT
ncbi:ImmA/IrrE family metallo-endopeptidase [Oceanobacillus sp. CFH 90083]|uniref:ImmA/IrrE family metallo-endopeptidase n=1 Tax=Oceanobacillus sp. CFH 90083 TaxID=2592336 RepID=UPI00128DA77E|nr:ImmA/IrrE family metallo-endopeptidase [Oceanobacillus sp. CFH 90083]